MVDKTNDPNVEDIKENDALVNAESVKSNVETVKLEDELKKSFIDYAMSVIVDRALPDVRDGLKPVHRRVLYDMYDLKIWSSGQTKKSARVVGDVIGRFHPHGDVAVYETIVRMTQWFSMRAPLIFGQGNFGNIDGDGAAAMRYTEVKMTKMAEVMLQDIDKETVDTYPNYDGNEQIPEVLPTRFPNLLVNGSSGIAVGMATNIPPHNLAEVVNGAIAVLDNPEITVDELMKYVPGPDFPTGGLIVDNGGIADAYKTGRGRCVIRSKTHIEEDKQGRKTIYVDEIPYVVTKSSIVKQIADLIREKKIEGIAEVNDLSDKDNQVRIAIDLKRDAYPEAVLNNLFEKTALQSSFSINMIALVKNKPELLSLKDVLREFVNFRREVVTRRTVYNLRQDRRKAFLNEGLIVAKANINKIVDMITNSANVDDARARLMSEPWDGTFINTLIERTEEGVNICLPQGIDKRAGYHDGKYYLSEEQARAILALQLQRLTHLATEEIQADYKALLENIKGYLEILNNVERMKEVIRDELIEVRNAHADKRRTEFTVDMGKINKGDLIAKQDVVITLSHEGYIKYQDISNYQEQSRGGKGRMAAKLKDEDYISKVVIANTHDTLMCFSNKGRAFTIKVYDLPNSDSRTWRGRPIQNLFEIEEGEVINAMLPISEEHTEGFLVYATKTGLIKKTSLDAFKSFLSRCNGKPITYITLLGDDEVVSVGLSSGDDDVMLFTSNGNVLRINELYKGNTSLDDDTDTESDTDTDTDDNSDENLSDDENEDEDKIVAVKVYGTGIRPSGRSSRGIKGVKLMPGAKLVSMVIIPDDKRDDQILLVLSNGVGKRVKISAIPAKVNRGSRGVKCMRFVDPTSSLVSVVLVDEESQILVVTDKGQMLRTTASNISLLSRTAGGVKVIRPYEGEFVVGLESIASDVVSKLKETEEARRLEKQDLENMQNDLNVADESDNGTNESNNGATEDDAL